MTCALSAAAQEPGQDAGKDEQPKSAAASQSSGVSKETKWQWFFVAANLYPRLDESESKIDRLINGRLGALFPRWEEPRTFGDWRDDGQLWDFQVGIGRDINPEWNWYVSVGGTYGKQENTNWYMPLGIPLGFEIDFQRWLWFVSSGVDWYFLGPPELASKAAHPNPLMRRLAGTKPYAEFAVGYINLHASCRTTPELPFRSLFTYNDHARYDLFYWSPRVGIDIPLTERDSVSFAVGYLFFTNHPTEFNNVSIYTIYRHRF